MEAAIWYTGRQNRRLHGWIHASCWKQGIEAAIADRQIIGQSSHTNLAMTWTDYKKPYDSVSHSWILECLRLYRIYRRLVTFIRQLMSHWRKKSITDITIKCCIYQRDALAPLLFCIRRNPLNVLLDKTAYGYRLKGGTIINHPYVDNINLYARMSRTSAHWCISLGCLVLTFAWQSGKVRTPHCQQRQGEERQWNQPTRGSNDDLDESYKYLGMLQSFSNVEEVHCKATSKYRNRESSGRKLSSKNKVTAINTFAVPVIRYSAAVVR